MKIRYAPGVDILTIILLDDPSQVESDEIVPGVVIDQDQDGNITTIEIQGASKRLTDPSVVTVQMGTAAGASDQAP